MKRFVVTIIIICLALSLSGCKSQEVKDVEAMIDAIGEVTIANSSKVDEAATAYAALSQKDQEKVENRELLIKAESDLYVLEYFNLSTRIADLTRSCRHVLENTYVMWTSAREIFDKDDPTYYLTFVRGFNIDQSVEAYKEQDPHFFANCMVAAYGLRPDLLTSRGTLPEENQQEVIDSCVEYNAHYDNISTLMEPLAADVMLFCEKYQEAYPEEVEVMRKWLAACEVCVNFAIEPSGRYSNYLPDAEELYENVNEYAGMVDEYLKDLAENYDVSEPFYDEMDD